MDAPTAMKKIQEFRAAIEKGREQFMNYIQKANDAITKAQNAIDKSRKEVDRIIKEQQKKIQDKIVAMRDWISQKQAEVMAWMQKIEDKIKEQIKSQLEKLSDSIKSFAI